MGTQGAHHALLDAPPLEVHLKPDSRKPFNAEGECLVEGRQIGRDSPEPVEGARAYAATRGAVAHFVQVVRMGEHERSVGDVEDVELEHVAAQLDRQLQRAQCVLGRKRRGASMADAGEVPGRPPQVEHYVLFTTTTAQSSASSPRAKARQSSSTACAS